MSRERVVFLSTSIGVVASSINTSIVSTVLPTIQQDLGLSYAAVQWIVTAYMVVLSALVLPLGALGDLIGHRKVFQVGLAIFGLFSLLIGLADSFVLILGARILQAVGGAMLVVSVPAILTSVFPPSQRGHVLGLYAMTVYIGISLGPIVGGYLATWWGWPAIFFLNVPMSVLAIVLARIPKYEVEQRRNVRFDWLGSAIFLVGLSSFLVSINRGFTVGWTPLWLGILVLSIVLGFAFVRVELRNPSPMLAIGLLRDRVIALGVSSTLLNYTAMFFFYFLLPVYLITLIGWPESTAGLLITATPVAMVVTSSISGRLSDRIGTRLPATAGMLVLAMGLGTIGIFQPTGRLALVAAFVAVGVGLGMFTAPNNSSIMGAAPRSMQGMASGIVATARYSGQALGVIIASMLFELLRADSQARGEGFTAFRYAILVGAALALVGAISSFLAAPRHTPAAVPVHQAR